MIANQHLIKMKKLNENQSSIAETVNPQLLPHVLSPLELVAITNDFKPFTYQIGNKSYQVTQDYCYYLKTIVSAKLEHFQKFEYSKVNLSKKSKQKQTDSFVQFTRTPINALQISKLLKYRLNYMGYKKVSQLLYDSHSKVATQKGISLIDIKELIALFEKNDCLTLFMRRY